MIPIRFKNSFRVYWVVLNRIHRKRACFVRSLLFPMIVIEFVPSFTRSSAGSPAFAAKDIVIGIFLNSLLQQTMSWLSNVLKQHLFLWHWFPQEFSRSSRCLRYLLCWNRRRWIDDHTGFPYSNSNAVPVLSGALKPHLTDFLNLS